MVFYNLKDRNGKQVFLETDILDFNQCELDKEGSEDAGLPPSHAPLSEGLG